MKHIYRTVKDSLLIRPRGQGGIKLHITKQQRVAQPVLSVGDHGDNAVVTIRYGMLFSKMRKLHLSYGPIGNKKEQKRLNKLRTKSKKFVNT